MNKRKDPEPRCGVCSHDWQLNGVATTLCKKCSKMDASDYGTFMKMKLRSIHRTP